MRFSDLAGRRVRRLMDETDAGPGLHLLTITANSGGERLDPGIYFYRMKAGRFVARRAPYRPSGAKRSGPARGSSTARMGSARSRRARW